MAIRLLPAQLANQIAAGEVVERPASVVKELVENSLDAGATRVWIDIEKGGARRIRIRDNGSGIERDELTLALSRHATSKIATLDDLEAILSLGFRGEALASISSVARLRLVSKPATQEEAWEAWCEGRDMEVQLAPTAHPDGTTVDVQDLFFNTPARRKFMRTEKTEFGHIDEVVRRIALARPDVDIQLSHNQQTLRQFRAVPVANLNESPTDEQQQAWARRLEQIVGKRFSTEAAFVSNTQVADSLSMFGWLAPPDACRHQADLQYIYVNGRMMKDKLLSHAIRQAYMEWLAEDRQPTYVLYLRLPAQHVDVNVHPAKHEVRFHQARQVHDFVLATVREALLQLQGLRVPENEVSHHYQQAEETYRDAFPETRESARPNRHGQARLSSGEEQHNQQYWSMAGGILPGARAPESSENTSESRSDWQVMDILQQRYLLLKQGDDQLALLDLIKAHQHVRSQQLHEQLSQGLSGQPLLLPIQIKVAADQVITDNYLHRLGIHYEQQRRTGDQQSLRITHVPASLRKANLASVLPQLFCQLGELSPQLDSRSQAQALMDAGIAAWLAGHERELIHERKRAEQIWQQLQTLLSMPDIESDWLQRLDWQKALPAVSVDNVKQGNAK